ncbi:MAG: hypothetical protein H7Y60_06450 [Rhodospirillaceae bacterium]|nr:hypothetical protein [Rhodospirillales bacterium]
MAEAYTVKSVTEWLAALSHAQTFDLRFIHHNRAPISAEEREALPETHWEKLFPLRDKPGHFSYRSEQFPDLTAEEVMRRIDLAAHYNCCGYQIYCRPNNYRYIFLDDVADFPDPTTAGKTVEGVWKFIRPADGRGKHLHTVQVESSPGNHQVWFDAGDAVGDEWTNKALAHYLAQRFGGDAGAVNRRQSGRLPGFRNTKPKYLQPNGTYPAAKLHTHKQRVDTTLAYMAAKDPEITKMANQMEQEATARIAHDQARQARAEERRRQIEAGVAPVGRKSTTSDPIKLSKLPSPSQEYQSAWGRQGNGCDRSAVDFGILCRMARLMDANGLGYDPDDLIDVVATHSPKAKERLPTAARHYAEVTVTNAFNHVGRG